MIHPLYPHLLRLEKPGRYTGGEFNSTIKEGAFLRWCLVYPDTYEIGMSNLGLAILYEALNARPGVCAERAFLPWVDAIGLMEAERIPLFSLETKSPVLDFDVVGITLQTELTYTNALKVLELSGIPILSEHRGNQHPLVIAGGPCTVNPLPLSRFFDALVIGDGEDVILEMEGPLLAWARRDMDRDAVLKELAKIRGVYVPGYNRGTARRFAELPRFPRRPVVPNIAITHDRLTIELTRGCLAGCRFCQGGFCSRPLRLRDPEDAASLAKEGLMSTGWDEIGLSGFSLSEYPWLEEVISRIREDLPWVRISLPSLPADALERILPLIGGSRTSSFTLAPETASERLARVINKSVPPESVLRSLEAASRFRVKHVKLYFMIGLPTETEEDLRETGRFLRKIARAFPSLNIKASFATFVPRPFTPFQWEPQIGPDEARARFRIVKSEARARNLSLTMKDPFGSLLEGVLARGGEELSEVILGAYREGALFDDWTEGMRPSAWLRAFESSGRVIEDYMKPKEPGSFLPYNIIESGIKEDFLLSERAKAIGAEVTPSCRGGSCANCGPYLAQGWRYCFGLPEPNTVLSTTGKRGTGSERPKKGFVINLSKHGPARFLSGNDTMRVLTRAISRAGFFMCYTKGYVMRPRLSSGPPAPLGVASDAEMFYIEIEGEDEGLSERLGNYLPEGFGLVSCEEGRRPAWGEIVGIIYELPEGLEPLSEVRGLSVEGRRLVHEIGSGSFHELFEECFGPDADMTGLRKKGYVWKGRG